MDGGYSRGINKIPWNSSKKETRGCHKNNILNANSFNKIIRGNEKVEKAKDVIDELKADVVFYNEHIVNARHKENHNGLNLFFWVGESDNSSVVAHNVHENMSRVQDSGTSMLLFGPLI